MVNKATRKFKGPDHNFDGIDPKVDGLSCALCGNPIIDRSRATWFTPSGIFRTIAQGELIKKHISGPTAAACPNCCLKLIKPFNQGGYGQKVRWSDPDPLPDPSNKDWERERLTNLSLTPLEIDKALKPKFSIPSPHDPSWGQFTNS